MEPPIVLSREQSRRVDKIAVERYGMSSLVLMENAGRGVAEELLKFDPSLLTGPPAGPPRGPGPAPAGVAIVCGKGNNAGDGFVLARHLEIRGVAAHAILLFAPEELADDARHNYDILKRAGAPITDLSRDVTADGLAQCARGAAWLVDAMLGTGATGEPREPIRTAIEWMNSQGARRLATDVPSGLDCDSGEPAAATVRADLTCTFVAEKLGFSAAAAREFLGERRIASIGVPPRLVRELAAD